MLDPEVMPQQTALHICCTAWSPCLLPKAWDQPTWVQSSLACSYNCHNIGANMLTQRACSSLQCCW